MSRMAEPAPENTLGILDMDVTALIDQLQSRSLTSVEAVKTCIKHLEHANPKVNCLVENRFGEALEEAKEADRLLESGKASGALTGVPISMKESFDVSGMKTTGGLKHRAGAVAQNDAEVVAALKKEGAIILGKTNTPALCFCQETDNKLFGKTNNPWDLNKTAGGSSGGEGALIAVGGAAAGIGSDIGGSIRFPSHFNGVVGFKSGNGQVSDTGSFPDIVHPIQKRMLGIGPMAKSVRDVRLIYSLISTQQKSPSAKLSDITIHKLPANTYPLGESSGRMIQKIADYLNQTFWVGIEIPPYFQESAIIWQEIMSVDGGRSVADTAGFRGHGEVVKEYVKETLLKRSDYHYYLTWALIGAKMFKPSQKRILEIEKVIEKGDEIISDYFENKILLLPVYHRTAPPHGKLYSELFSVKKTFKKFMPYVAYANVWGLPSLTVPAGKDENGMPIGVQLVSKSGNEERLFALGELIEAEFGGYVRCTAHDQEKDRS
ncbi:amidase [Siminovitchia sp. 179-K 8D1 HS]|uniref:amidase n=1 Tax=Siminovitchia sp. 179-K 8D1 HS TaxID=3142385 RepID=UPI0039A3E89B